MGVSGDPQHPEAPTDPGAPQVRSFSQPNAGERGVRDSPAGSCLATMATPFEIDLELPRDLRAPAIARDRVRQTLAEVIDHDRVSELAIVFSELVSNAVDHGRG